MYFWTLIGFFFIVALVGVLMIRKWIFLFKYFVGFMILYIVSIPLVGVYEYTDDFIDGAVILTIIAGLVLLLWIHHSKLKGSKFTYLTLPLILIYYHLGVLFIARRLLVSLNTGVVLAFYIQYLIIQLRHGSKEKSRRYWLTGLGIGVVMMLLAYFPIQFKNINKPIQQAVAYCRENNLIDDGYYESRARYSPKRAYKDPVEVVVIQEDEGKNKKLKAFIIVEYYKNEIRILDE